MGAVIQEQLAKLLHLVTAERQANRIRDEKMDLLHAKIDAMSAELESAKQGFSSSSKHFYKHQWMPKAEEAKKFSEEEEAERVQLGGQKGRRMRELTFLVQKLFKFPENNVELYAKRVNNRGLCAIDQAESLCYKLLGGLAMVFYNLSWRMEQKGVRLLLAKT